MLHLVLHGVFLQKTMRFFTRSFIPRFGGRTRRGIKTQGTGVNLVAPMVIPLTAVWLSTWSRRF